MSLKLGIQHLALEYYQVCSNDDPGLTCDLLMQRSTLVSDALYGKPLIGRLLRKYFSLLYKSWYI